MKKNKFFSLLAAACMVVGFTACNNSSDGTATNDSPGTKAADSSNLAGGTNTTNDYAAFADSVERNSQAGYYLNPKTGKKLNLKVNRSSGAVTNAETNEPVWRYVDNRNWWVYGLDDDYYWYNIGEAKPSGDKLVYKDDDSDKWIDYDARWKSTDENLDKTWKTKSGDVKIKFGKDGDIKVKDKDGKTKYDADDNKVKTDTSKKN